MKVSIDLTKRDNENLYNYALANAHVVKHSKENYTPNMMRIVDIKKRGLYNVEIEFMTAFKDESLTVHENQIYKANISLIYSDTPVKNNKFTYTGRELISEISYELTSDEMYKVGILNLNKLATVCERGYSDGYDKFIVFAHPSSLNPWMRVEGPAEIVAFGSAHIKTGNEARASITLFENSSCDSWGHDVIYAYNNAAVDIMGASQYITAKNSANINLRGPVYAYVTGNVTYNILSRKECVFVEDYRNKKDKRVMNINEDLIKKIAENASPLKGEAVKVAKWILEKGLVSEFLKHAHSYEGADESWQDFQDCLLDFSCRL